MKVAVWLGGPKFVIEQRPDPAPAEGHVVVKVDTVGVCGSDVHITQGLFPATPPQVLGHEFSGVIVAAGAGVARSRIGERVACDISSHCGECHNCREWNWSRCERAQRSSGAFAEFSTVPTQSAHVLPQNFATELGALTEPASCCYSGVGFLAIPRDAVAVVIGAGIMGLFTIAALKARGVRTVIASEPVAARREFARQLGADILNDPAREDIGEVVKQATGGHGAHIAVEVVGKPALVAKAVEVVRPRGQVLMIGVSNKGTTLPSDLYDLHYKEVVLRGAFGRGDAFGSTVGEIAKLDLRGVITAKYPLERVYDSIKDSADGRGIKLVVKPNGGA
jgi:(R,R)-butanediol dehydrogenase/meso-butanediol dehydrogenase/diacetyl reductase